MQPFYEVRSREFVVDPANPERAHLQADDFYHQLPVHYPSPDSPMGGIGDRLVPFFFLAGGLWVVVYILIYHKVK